MKTISKQTLFCLILVLLLGSSAAQADDWTRVKNLKGWWKFSIGDNGLWATPGFDDHDWEKVFVPSAWEDEGFHGYNGYAWYRKEIEIDSDYKNDELYLFLGYVDDVDEVYLNGKLIGFTGSFPPNYETAYYSERKYRLPKEGINFDGKNIIAVRVFDYELNGGITSGKVGIFSFEPPIDLKVDLSGKWKFKTRDDLERKNKNYYDADWDKIIVPGLWETQGYRDYNGFAWYRKSFTLPKNLKDEKLVLMLGKIDDIDQVYINGRLIGSTGDFVRTPVDNYFNNEWLQFRGYYIPKDILSTTGENVIAVRVYDGYRDGGIYEGPIGIVTQEDYIDFWRGKKKKNLWEIIWGD